MEQATLRPLGVGDIVDRVFAIYRSRPLMFIAIAAIPYLVLILVGGALGLTFAGTFISIAQIASADEVTPATIERLLPDIGRLTVFLLVIVVAAIAVSLIQSASLIDAAAARYLGKDATVGSALRTGLRASGRLFAMGIVAFLAFIALWIALTIFMAVTQQWWSILAGIGGGLVVSVYLAASWMVAPAITTLEGAGPVASLRRSWSLSAGNRWRILGLILLLSLLQVVLSSILSGVLVAAFFADQTVRAVMQFAVNIFATIAWAPVYWGTFAVLYYDLRVRREAFDLQLAAEALPRAT